MNDIKISDLGNRIDYLRFLRGDVNKTTFCKESGISRSTLNNIENGVEPTLETLLKIADYFDTTVDYLLGRTQIVAPEYAAQSAKLTKSIKPETYVKTYMDYLKRNKVFGENEQTYTHLGQALILMLKNA